MLVELLLECELIIDILVKKGEGSFVGLGSHSLIEASDDHLTVINSQLIIQ